MPAVGQGRGDRTSTPTAHLRCTSRVHDDHNHSSLFRFEEMQILALLAKLRAKRNMSIIVITHDFGVATNFCDRIIVMYAGMVMESAPVRDFLRRPAHPYTIGLKESVIEVGDRGRPLRPIPGIAEPLTAPPTSCPYAARCTFAIERCRRELPALRSVTPGHRVACHRAEEVMTRAS